MEALVAGLIVGLAGFAGRGWLAEYVERVALVATGPVAGEPALARAAAASMVRPDAPPAPRPGAARSVVGSASAGRLAPAAVGRAWAVRLAPAAVGLAAAAVGGVVGWASGGGAALLGLVFLAGAGFVLAPVDVRSHRLPDAIVLPAYPILALLLSLGGPTHWVRAIEGGAVAFAVLYVLAIAAPAGFGYGDVKLTGLLGAALGWFGWPEVLAGLVYGFAYGGLGAAALLVTRRLSRTDRLAFGPFLLAGALTAVVFR
ncbi:prepilin peptidase [Cryptosporangium phraense]|uniref:Prepilin peptidase n=1 Tax=Cryptosporangium phraense TaxID=2593070 RepID=A0A545ALK9_9ACTN|nr:A24 family peptidase [Cryptosporangium phraense]TQS41615.1 prepilin peptidase [Cryptosporangium phraense]